MRKLKHLQVDRCPFANLPDDKKSRWGAGITADEMREMQWTKPQLAAQIRFVEFTGDGRLQHADLLGLRTDKDAREVRREYQGTRGEYRQPQLCERFGQLGIASAAALSGVQCNIGDVVRIWSTSRAPSPQNHSHGSEPISPGADNCAGNVKSLPKVRLAQLHAGRGRFCDVTAGPLEVINP